MEIRINSAVIATCQPERCFIGVRERTFICRRDIPIFIGFTVCLVNICLIYNRQVCQELAFKFEI